MNSHQTYPLTPTLFPSGGVILIFDAAGCRLATFACQFLEQGHVLSWRYILDACQIIVKEPGQLHHEAALPSTESANIAEAVCLNGSPLPGRYRYVRLDGVAAPFEWTQGPRFKFKRRGPEPDAGDDDTMSHSSRSTAQQSAFRNQLYKRDAFCIVTDEDDAEAAHILPQSRPEYYEEALCYDPVHYFHVSFGILLDRNLHSAFDRGDWGLYPDPDDDSVLLVHVFNSQRFRAHHGQRICRDRFRIKDAADLPNRALLRFHYDQCVIKHIRGFSFF